MLDRTTRLSLFEARKIITLAGDEPRAMVVLDEHVVSTGSRTDLDDHGMQTTSTRDLADLVRMVHMACSRLGVHANGDRPSVSCSISWSPPRLNIRARTRTTASSIAQSSPTRFLSACASWER
jgi:hypothetical protein